MFQEVKLTDHIYYVGVNDRRTALFENLWPLERGVAYNSYIIDDEKVTLIDTVEIGYIDKFLSKIRAAIGDKPIDYLIINHMEPDHAGSVKILSELYPDMKLVGNKKTRPMVEGFFGITDKFKEVGEGDSLVLGHHQLQFFMVPMVHWPETMVTYNPEHKILFSADAFGSFGTLDGGIFDDELDIEYFIDEMRRYYSNIVGKYGNPVQKALSKLSGLEIKTIAATHGPILRENIERIVTLYDKWSKYEAEENGVVIAYASMYGHTEEMAEVIARELALNGVKQIRIYDVSKTHASYIISDIFKYKGVILGSPTYSNELHPNMESLVNKLENMGVKNHLLGTFGSFTWSGAAVKRLDTFAEKMGWEVVGESVEEKHALKDEKYNACLNLARGMAGKLS
ncbi:FprA family A-type flavoprotein [Alkalitalea saponilacus]|uniref:Flavorubredoxin n=1 Tax=Alkalitalea saponilacus TaxID=889453 RepID=A0A1T5H1E9_9BACT|nr:FprA family A-type flavoprotein [Alkalitalea saponilacus]ASB50933.1 FprA family A-type flavoprotein [Alkalitalea saponilacus]SKC14506.1 Flavorubredoxin [Alkalitalea saponilacus]